MLGRILRGFLLASSATLLAAGAVALAARRSRRDGAGKPNTLAQASGPCGAAVQDVTLAPETHAGQRRNFFSLTRSRSKNAQPKWVLQGFGRYQCFLLFDSWQEAMDQATFRVESLGVEVPKLVRIGNAVAE